MVNINCMIKSLWNSFGGFILFIYIYIYIPTSWWAYLNKPWIHFLMCAFCNISCLPSGEKPFKCDQCSYVASNQHEVTRHARQVHNGPKPLNCPHCDYKTADRSNFKKHVELHVNPRQFNCPVCDYAASKKCNLQYHFKSKHPTCPNKTMDVSKVKLKKTKKREADLPDNKLTSKKTETEHTKWKGDA